MKYLEKEHNYDILLKNIHGDNALDAARYFNHKDIVKYLTFKIRKSKFKTIIDCNLIENITDNKNKKCYICLEEFTKGDKYCKCHNGHIYHEDCFFELPKDECCICRKENILKAIFIF